MSKRDNEKDGQEVVEIGNNGSEGGTMCHSGLAS